MGLTLRVPLDLDNAAPVDLVDGRPGFVVGLTGAGRSSTFGFLGGGVDGGNVGASFDIGVASAAEGGGAEDEIKRAKAEFVTRG